VFAGKLWPIRSPAFCLPCRRSRVRIPSAALERRAICRSFLFRQSASASESSDNHWTMSGGLSPHDSHEPLVCRAILAGSTWDLLRPRGRSRVAVLDIRRACSEATRGESRFHFGDRHLRRRCAGGQARREKPAGPADPRSIRRIENPMEVARRGTYADGVTRSAIAQVGDAQVGDGFAGWSLPPVAAETMARRFLGRSLCCAVEVRSPRPPRLRTLDPRALASGSRPDRRGSPC